MRKLDGRIRAAFLASLWRGHTIPRFVRYGDIAFAICTKCGKGVYIKTRAMPNDMEMSGSAVALNCES